MGRSKKSPSGNSVKNTPKVTEILKISAKRPLPSGSDTNDEDDPLMRIDNGVPTGKKGKFVEADDSASYEEDSEDEVDDDDDDDDDEIDGDDDESDEDEDDSDASEDEDLPESVASDEKEKTSAKTEKHVRKDNKNEDSIKIPTPREPVSGSAKKSKNKQLDNTAKVSCLSENESNEKTIPSMTKTSSAHLVVVRPPTQLGDLRTAMINQGVKVEDVHLVNYPMALVTCSADSADNILNKPVSVDGNTIHVLRLHGSSAALDAFRGLSTALFVTGLPKSVTEEQIKAALPKNSQPTSLRLLTEGLKNKFFNAARLDFSTAKDAVAASSKLSSVNFENHRLRISFVRGAAENKETSELRGKTKTLLAVQLHSSVTEDQLKNIFKTAVKLNLITRGFDRLCYVEFSDSTEAASAYDAHNGSSVGHSKLVLRFVPTRDENRLLVSNVPFESTSNDLLKIFPGASAAVMINKGYYVVHFPSARVRSEAVSSTKIIGERKLSISCDGGLDQNICLLRNLPFEAKQSDIESLLPTASSVEIHHKANGRSTGNATVTFPTASACKEAMKKKISIGNRTIAITLKRVSLDDSQSLDRKRPSTNEATTPAKKQKTLPLVEKKIVKQNVKSPPQVGSASEDDDDEDEEDDDEEEEEQVSKKAPLAESDAGTDSEDESDDEDDEDDDGEQDEDDSGDDDDENSEESDEDTPMPPSKKNAADTYSKKPKFETNGKFQKGSNFNKDTQSGGNGFKPQQRGRGGFQRGRVGDFGGQFKPRGGGGGFRGNSGFGRGRGGGDRGRGNSGGFRGRGKFNNRGGGR